MARKRLNKKVVLIGSAVFIFLVFAAIAIILYLSQDPQKFIEDGDLALQAAREATDEELKEQEYERAGHSYSRARARAKTDKLKIQILFKLTDLFIEIEKWPNVLGCWDAIIQLDKKNSKARFGRLKYFYIMADNGMTQAWKEIATQASDFIETADETLLAENPDNFESFEIQPRAVGETMEVYLHLIRGKATLETARDGSAIEPEEILEAAIGDLERVIELEPASVDAHWYLFEAYVTKAGFFASKNDIEQRDVYRQHAKEILEQSVKAADDNAKAHINLIRVKPMLEQLSTVEQLEALESEYLSVAERFSTDAYVHSTLATYYWLLGHEKLDKALESIEKAIELDKENVAYSINAANLYYKKFSIYGGKPSLNRAVEIAQNALALPDAQDIPGPRYWANKTNRDLLYSFLANSCIEQVFEARQAGEEDGPETQRWLKKAEEAVHQIEQIYGSGEDPKVVKWRGMLELVKGNREAAVRKLYSTYEKYKAAGRRDTQLAYTLGRLFADTVELGAATEFFVNALSVSDRSLPNKIDETKPESVLEYTAILLKINAYDEALSLINFFEVRYWPTRESEQLCVNAYIASNQPDKAEEKLAESEKLSATDKIKLNIGLLHTKIDNVRRNISRKSAEKQEEPLTSVRLLETELKGHIKTLAELVDKRLATEPDFLQYTSILTLCNSYISEGRIDKARQLVDTYLVHFPDDAIILTQKQVFSEPDLKEVTEERLREIRKQVLSKTEDPLRRALRLGVFYDNNNEPNQAIEKYKTILAPYLTGSAKAKGLTDEHIVATGYLFDIALKTEQFELADKVVDFTRRENIDKCEGKLFAARLAIVRGRYDDALSNLNECLKQRPIFSYGYMLRSQTNKALGNKHASIDDARRAITINPMDSTIAKVWADVLYQRNLKLGDDVTVEQVSEVKDALINAIRLNPEEWHLQGLFAEYISDENPEDALAIRQRLQKAVPTLRNVLMLGRMAMRMAEEELSPSRKKALYDIAASSFEEAREIGPESKSAIRDYVDYYRITGQREKAEQLLTETKSPRLMWRYYVQTGQLSKAKELLEQLYQSDAGDIDIVKGLSVIAERTGDKESLQKYFREMLLLKDSVDNRLAQIDSFLKMGLVKQADIKLRSFKEKYPNQIGYLLLEASLAMKKGQLEEALELANNALQNQQNDSKAWRLRGEINRLLANYSQSIIDFKKSKAMEDNPVTRLMLARAYIRADRNNEAVVELKNIIDDPQVSHEGRMLLEQTYWKLGRTNALSKLYQESLEKFPDNTYWYNQAASFSMRIRDFDTAERLYLISWRKGSRDSFENIAAIEGYLDALLAANKLNRLFAEAGKYVDGDFAPVAYIKMAEGQVKLEDMENAVVYCQKAIEKSGTNEEFVSTILRKMYNILGPEEVRKVCEKRLRENPESLAANFGMFNLVSITGEYNKAIDYIDKCLEIVGPDDRRTTDYIIQKAGILQAAHIKTSDKSYLQKAVIEYKSLLDKWPNNTSVLNNLAYLMTENNESPEEALEYARRVYEINPDHPGFLDTYAYTLYKNGKYEKASQHLQASLQQFEAQKLSVPWDVYEHLGMVNEKLDERLQAYDAYKQALELLSSGQSGFEEAKERIKQAIERLSQ